MEYGPASQVTMMMMMMMKLPILPCAEKLELGDDILVPGVSRWAYDRLTWRTID